MSTGTPGRWVLPVRHFLIGVTRVIFRVNRDLGLTTNRPIPGVGKGLRLWEISLVWFLNVGLS